MNKQTYLAKLAQLLTPLPEQERQDALNYYEEYFDAAGPEAEDATAAELGDPADAARKILEGEGLTLDATPSAAGESAGSDAKPTPSAEKSAPAGQSASHDPAAIPPAVGVLVGIAGVLVIIIAAIILLFGMRGRSITSTAETLVVSAAEAPLDADPTTETPGNEPAAEESGTASEGPSAAADDNTPHTTDMAFDNITPLDAVLDIDYGRLTIVIDPGATSAVLHCEHVYPKRFDITYTDNEPLTIRYKVPANCDLNSEPEPEFILSVPDADTFHFQKLSITSAMGDVEFDNNEAITADCVELNLAMGDFTCSTVQADSFTATISMGNFTGGLVHANSFTADVSMGNFDLGVLEGAQTCSVNAGMGNIGLTVDGKADNYTLDLQASMGEVAFNGKQLGSSYTQKGSASRSVTLTAGMGDVVLTTAQ